MLKINKENNSIVVEGLDNAQYPHDGNLVFPLNSLMMVLDESDIVTFRSAANADTVFGGNINEIEIGGSAVDKDSIVAAWESVANASQGGGSGEGTVKSVNGVEPDENGNVEIEPELSKSVELVVLDDTGFNVETAQYYVNDLPPVDDWNVSTGQKNGLPYNVNYFITSDDTKTLKASFGDGENPMGYSFKVSTKLFVDVDGETKVVDYETPIGAGFNFMKKIADLYPFGEQYEPQLLMIKQDIYDADGNLLYISYNDASEYTHLWEKETVISTDVDGQTVQLATKDGVILNGENEGPIEILGNNNYIDISSEYEAGWNGVWVDNQYVDIYAGDEEKSSTVDVYSDHIDIYTDTPEGNTHLTVEKDGAYISNGGGETKKKILVEGESPVPDNVLVDGENNLTEDLAFIKDETHKTNTVRVGNGGISESVIGKDDRMGLGQMSIQDGQVTQSVTNWVNSMASIDLNENGPDGPQVYMRSGRYGQTSTSFTLKPDEIEIISRNGVSVNSKKVLTEDDKVVKTVNGQEPDANGNVNVEGGGSDKDVLVNLETRDSFFETYIDLMTKEGSPDNVFSVNVKDEETGLWNDVVVTGEYSEIYAGTEGDTSYVDVWNNGQGVEIYAGHYETEGEETIETNTTLKVMPDGVFITNDGGETMKRVLTEDDLAGINELLERLLN